MAKKNNKSAKTTTKVDNIAKEAEVKNTQAAAVKAPEETKAKPETKPETKSQPAKPKDTKPKEATKPKEEPKAKPTAKVDSTGKVEAVEAEEVKHKTKEQEVMDAFKGKPSIKDFTDKYANNEKFSFDANHAAIFLDAVERRTSKMKDGKQKIAMENLLDYNMAFYIMVMAVQIHDERKQLNMSVPNDELVLQQYIDTFSSLGVALEAHPDKENKENVQLTITGWDENAEKAAKEELAKQKEAKKEEVEVEKSPAEAAADIFNKHHVWTEDELDPKNWDNDDVAKAALTCITQQTNETPAKKLMKLLYNVRLYKIYHSDEDKKAYWERVDIGELTKELHRILSNKFSLIQNGICAASVNHMKTGGTVLAAHAMLKKNMPQLSDVDIHDLLNVFIEIKNDPNVPIDQCAAVVKGINSLDRDKILRISQNNPSSDEEKADFRKIYEMFYKGFVNEVGSKMIQKEGTEELVNNPDFPINFVNKMIEIYNLYVAEGSKLNCFTVDEYPKSSSK